MSKVRTLEDIAQLAGVSRATASRALRDSSLISKETRARVQAIAREQNYRPNIVARNLRLKQSQAFALVIPFREKDTDYLSDPFLLQFVGLVGAALRRYGYDLLLAQAAAEDQEVVDRYIHSGRAAGLILIGRSTFNEALMAQVPPGTPLVVWGPALPGQGFGSVGVDNVAAAQEAVQHLIDQGCRRIAFLGKHEQEACLESFHRYQGYRAALEQAGLPFDPALVAEGDYTSRSGYEGMERILAQAPGADGVFANSDVLAIAAQESLRQAGRRVPEDVAVVGFDNIPLGAYACPPLTTVSQNLAEMGAEQLVRNLMQQVDGETAVPVTLPHQLIVRRSSTR